MLSDELADLSETVLGEERIPRDLRAHFAVLLADHAERAVALERGYVPPGCVDLSAERARRCRPAPWGMSA